MTSYRKLGSCTELRKACNVGGATQLLSTGERHLSPVYETTKYCALLHWFRNERTLAPLRSVCSARMADNVEPLAGLSTESHDEGEQNESTEAMDVEPQVAEKPDDVSAMLKKLQDENVSLRKLLVANQSVKDLPEFSGAAETISFAAWVVRFADHMVRLGVAEEDYVLNALPALGEDARVYARQNGLTHASSWDDFVHVLSRGPWAVAPSAHTLRTELDGMKQGEDSVQEFVRKVSAKLAKLPDSSELERCHVLLRGLRPSVHNRVLCNPHTGDDWQSFAELAAYACKVAAHLPSAQPGGPSNLSSAQKRRQEGWQLVLPKDKASKGKGKAAGGRPSKRPAYEARDGLSPEVKAERDQKRLCYACGKPGHRANDKGPNNQFVCPARK